MPQPKSFQALRQQLDGMGFFQPLVLDALPLVESLLNELVATKQRNQELEAKAKQGT